MKITIRFDHGAEKRSTARRFRRAVRERGFALVAVLMMMILLVMVAVALLSLSSVSLRSTSMEGASKTAKANARLALYLALADLQKNLGPDQAVTADAGIFGEDVPRPHMVGAWHSFEDQVTANPNASGPDYSDLKGKANFKGWLVSKEDSTPENEDPAYGNSDASSDAIRLFRENTDGYDMSADLVEVDGGGRNKGGFAWAVSQAATKASINAGKEYGSRYTNAILHAPDRPNLELSELAKQPVNGWDTRHSKVISMKQAVLDPEYQLDKESAAKLAVEHTAQSRGVLADVARGGLKTDMSLGFEMDKSDFLASNWDGLENPFARSNEERPLYEPRVKPETVKLELNYDDVFKYNMLVDSGAPPTFSALRSHYRMYKHMYRDGGVPTARQRFQSSPYYSTGAPRGSETSMNPVLDRMIIYVSLTLESNVPAMLLTPVVTLWNPYNVAIESDGYVVYPWMDLPMDFTVKVKDTATSGYRIPNPGGQGNTSRFLGRGHGEGWNDQGHGRQAEPYFYCKITQSGTSSVSSPVRLEPGEVKMFVPGSSQPGGASGGGVVPYKRESPDNDTSRMVFMKPFDGSTAYTKFGLRVSIRQMNGSAAMTETMVDPNKQISMELHFRPNQYHYFVNLEDARRITNPIEYKPSDNFSRITEAQVMRGQGQNISTPETFYTRAQLPKVIAALETFHRVAEVSENGPGSDIVYTVNPRHRHTNYTFSGATSMQNAHYAATLRHVTDIGADLIVDGSKGRGFYGISNGSNGETILPFFDVPEHPMMSLGAFQSADLANSAFGASSPFGNSWASPYVPITSVSKVLTRGSGPGANTALSPSLGLYDHSYLLNSTLWDQFYFSSIAPEATLGSRPGGDPYSNDDGLAQESKSIDRVVREWISDPVGYPLRNTRHILHKGGLSDDELEAKLTGTSGAREAAAHMLVDGSFNVNSTNVKAWAAMLASLRGKEIQTNYGNNHSSNDNTPVVRMSQPMGTKNNIWNGFREISDEEIETLAEAIVDEVRERGPFQSLSEFVNRRLENSDLGKKGALQAAIEKAGLNKGSEVSTFNVGSYPERNNITINNTGVGTPGWITQADLLTPLAPFITVRSDTFTIRTYGDARDTSGNIIARSYCEAVVQRVPEFVDPKDSAATSMDNVSDVNRTFGRKFEIVSIREISSSEIES